MGDYRKALPRAAEAQAVELLIIHTGAEIMRRTASLLLLILGIALVGFWGNRGFAGQRRSRCG